MTTTLHERHIAQLWLKMAQLFGHRWTSAYGERDVASIWLRALQGLTPKMLATGLEAITRGGDGWPPTAPEFRRICENSILRAHGLRDPEEALDEVLYNAHNPLTAKWSHNAVYIAGREAGWFALRRATDEKGKAVKEAFKRNYEIVTRKVIAGETFEEAIPKVLEDTRGEVRKLTELDREKGREAIAALKGIVK